MQTGVQLFASGFCVLRIFLFSAKTRAIGVCLKIYFCKNISGRATWYATVCLAYEYLRSSK